MTLSRRQLLAGTAALAVPGVAALPTASAVRRQGWGINPDRGGMTAYRTMHRTEPDFFLHSGDNIYADGPIQAEVKLADGNIWRNVVTEEVSKVAETLNEYRGRYKYNLLDQHVRAMNAEVPIVSQWDDHESVLRPRPDRPHHQGVRGLTAGHGRHRAVAEGPRPGLRPEGRQPTRLDSGHVSREPP